MVFPGGYCNDCLISAVADYRQNTVVIVEDAQHALKQFCYLLFPQVQRGQLHVVPEVRDGCARCPGEKPSGVVPLQLITCCAVAAAES